MQRTIGILVAAYVLATAASAVGETDGVIKMRLDVPGPSNLDADARSVASKEIAKRVVERLDARMNAAEIKFANIHRVDASTVEVRVESEVGRDLLRGLTLPPGNLRVRAVRRIGGRWQDRSANLPKQVQLRQGSGELDPSRAYLWSSERAPLTSFLDTVSFDDVDVQLFATDAGWRTFALGATVFTDEEVTDTEIRQTSTGTPYVSVGVESGGRDEFSNVASRFSGRFAVVLDGEIVGWVDESDLNDGTLNLSPPDQVAGERDQTEWARQIAGRLAASLPVKIVEVEE